MSKLYTPPFRVSFPHLFEPSVFKNADGKASSKPKYEVTMLFSKTRLKKNKKEKELFDALRLSVNACVKEKWPDKKKRPKNLSNPFQDGAEKEGDYDGYSDDIIFVKVRTEIKPGVLNENGKRITIENQEDLYAGCWAVATVSCYPYDFAGNRGVALGLMNLKKVEDDEPFGNRTTPEQDFGIDELEEDSAEDDFGNSGVEPTDELDAMFN